MAVIAEGHNGGATRRLSRPNSQGGPVTRWVTRWVGGGPEESNVMSDGKKKSMSKK